MGAATMNVFWRTDDVPDLVGALTGLAKIGARARPARSATCPHETHAFIDAIVSPEYALEQRVLADASLTQLPVQVPAIAFVVRDGAPHLVGLVRESADRVCVRGRQGDVVLCIAEATHLMQEERAEDTLFHTLCPKEFRPRLRSMMAERAEGRLWLLRRPGWRARRWAAIAAAVFAVAVLFNMAHYVAWGLLWRSILSLHDGSRATTLLVLCAAVTVVISAGSRAASGYARAFAGGALRSWLAERLLFNRPSEIRRRGASDLAGRLIEASSGEQRVVDLLLSVASVLSDACALFVIASATGWNGAVGLSCLWLVATLAFAGLVYRGVLGARKATIAVSSTLIATAASESTARVQGEFGFSLFPRKVASFERLTRARDLGALVFDGLLPRALPALVFTTLALHDTWTAGTLALLVVAERLGFHACAAARLGAEVGSAWDMVKPLLGDAPAGGPPSRPTEAAPTSAFAFHVARAEKPERSLLVQAADGGRLLVTGPSGGGKSSLCKTLAGFESSRFAGAVTANGAQPWELGLRAWRRRVVYVPQHHENHIFSASLVYNVLIGRGWPPTDRDVTDAEETCRALGLGDVIDRMPSRMAQMVGDSGWPLSHGERSRVLIARAILQRPDVLILDESLAPLDPAIAISTIRYVSSQVQTLIVVAHVDPTGAPAKTAETL